MRRRPLTHNRSGAGLSVEIYRAAVKAGIHRYQFKEAALLAGGMGGNLSSASAYLAGKAHGEYERAAYDRLSRSMTRYSPILMRMAREERHGILSRTMMLYARLHHDEVLGEPSGRCLWDASVRRHAGNRSERDSLLAEAA